MIYFKKVETTDKGVIYRFGNDISNITGLIMLKPNSLQYDIISYPNNETISDRIIAKLLIKYKENLLKGEYKDKMAYQV